jgi:ubiquinone/menaquinone biosynthesis C-methylase UbiE
MDESKEKLAPGDFSNVDAAPEATPYVAYLDQAAVALEEFRRVRDDLLDLRPGDQVLDVGCGAGDEVRLFAARVGSTGFAAGIDSSEAMVAEAHKRAVGLGLPVEFKASDAHRIDYPDDRFDACSAERVFVHLADPARALAEMIRVAKPGGRIAVRETDLELIVPDTSELAAARTIRTLFAESVRNGAIGRQLFRLFHESGLGEISITPQPIIANRFAMFNGLTLFEDVTRTAVERGVIAADAASALIADLRDRDDRGVFFACGVAFLGFGLKR